MTIWLEFLTNDDDKEKIDSKMGAYAPIKKSFKKSRQTENSRLEIGIHKDGAGIDQK